MGKLALDRQGIKHVRLQCSKECLPSELGHRGLLRPVDGQLQVGVPGQEAPKRQQHVRVQLKPNGRIAQRHARSRRRPERIFQAGGHQRRCHGRRQKHDAGINPDGVGGGMDGAHGRELRHAAFLNKRRHAPGRAARRSGGIVLEMKHAVVGAERFSSRDGHPCQDEPSEKQQEAGSRRGMHRASRTTNPVGWPRHVRSHGKVQQHIRRCHQHSRQIARCQALEEIQ